MSMLRIILLSTFAISANFLLGCSTVSEPVQETVDNTPTLSAEQRDELLIMLRKHKYNEELIQQWQQSQAGVTRLLAIESDLKTLIGQLNDMANDEPVVATQKNESEQVQDRPIAAAAPKVDIIEPEMRAKDHFFGFSAIQLAAMSRLESIKKSWKNASKLQPSLVGDLTPVAEVVERSSGTIYRLKAGRFSNKQDAILLCNQLRQANISCVATEYTAGAVYLPVN